MKYFIIIICRLFLFRIFLAKWNRCCHSNR